MDKKYRNQKQLVLLFGATGKSGYHIAHRLLESQNYPVRVVARNKQKLQELYKQRQMAFQSVIQGDATDQKVLERAFQESRHFGQVKIVISALGSAGFRSQQQISKVQSIGICKIIEISKKYKIQKFIFITAAFMQRPWHPITVILNTIVPNVYHHKVIAQNSLRQSGLKYIIVRPPELRGDFNDTTVTGYKIDQGDRLSGHISRRTLSEVVLYSLMSEQIPDKVTFECKAIVENEFRKQNFSILKKDNQKSIVKASHKLAKYTYWTLFTAGFIVGGLLLLNKYIKLGNSVGQSL